MTKKGGMLFTSIVLLAYTKTTAMLIKSYKKRDFFLIFR